MKIAEEEMLQTAMQALSICLEEIPFLNRNAITIRTNVPVGSQEVDIVAELLFPYYSKKLLIEVKGNGEPRYARLAAGHLLRLTEKVLESYGVFMAPFISEASQQICREEGIGFVDFSGNCRLAFGQVFIEKLNCQNKFKRQLGSATLFTSGRERIFRTLFENPKSPWKTGPLAAEAGVSVGQVSKVRDLLRDIEVIKENHGGFWLDKPEELLEGWTRHYTQRSKHTPYEFYFMESLSIIESRIAEVCDELGLKYALTEYAGAARYAPFAKYNRLAVYIERFSTEFLLRLNLKPVATGANLKLIVPVEGSVFYGTRVVDGISIASPIQVYLDLMLLKGPGKEAAEFLLNEVIRPTW